MAIVQALDRLTRFASSGFGVLVRADDADLHSFLASLTARPTRILLTGPHTDEFGETVSPIPRGWDRSGVRGHHGRGSDRGGRSWRRWHHSQGARVRRPDRAGHLIRPDPEVAATRRPPCNHLPFWVRGGIGPNTAAACLAAGARGVVLDSQVLLARESPLTESCAARVAGLDGSETAVLGARLGEAYRVYSRPDSPAAQQLAKEEERLLAADQPADLKLVAWRQAVCERIAADPADGAWPVGQDIALAVGLAESGVTVAGIVQTVCEQAEEATRTPRIASGISRKAHHSRSRTARSTRSCKGR